MALATNLFEFISQYQTIVVKDEAEIFVDTCMDAITPELDAEFMESLGVKWP